MKSRSRLRSPRCTKRPSISTKPSNSTSSVSNTKNAKAYREASNVDSDYYTDAIDYTKVKALREFETAVIAGGVEKVHGDVQVNRQIVGFKKIKAPGTTRMRARASSSMPEQQCTNDGVLAALPRPVSRRVHAYTPTEQRERLTDCAIFTRTIASLLLMCRPAGSGEALTEDISGGLLILEPDLYLYDSYAGGVGLSAPLFRLSDRLLERGHAELRGGMRREVGCRRLRGRTAPESIPGERGKEAALAMVKAVLGSGDASHELG